MPRVKKIDTTTGSISTTNPNISITQSFESSEIKPLELDLGRTDLNSLVDKLNEVIKKVNQ